MHTLHIENTVRDFDAWQDQFAKYERFRADHGVRSYRVRRNITAPNQVTVDLEFDCFDDAESFRGRLAGILATPASRDLLADHSAPQIFDVVVDQTL